MNDWTLSQRKGFLTDLLALPPKEIAQVQKKLTQLAEDPLPDAKVNKQLTNWKGGTLYILRCGDYRIFYTLEGSYISLLALRRRSEDTYDEEIDPIVYGGPRVELDRLPMKAGRAKRDTGGASCLTSTALRLLFQFL